MGEINQEKEFPRYLAITVAYLPSQDVFTSHEILKLFLNSMHVSLLMFLINYNDIFRF